MKKLIVIPLIVLLCGCSNMPKIVRELAKDKNNVSVTVNTIYGTIHYARSGATNAAVGADGSITPK